MDKEILAATVASVKIGNLVIEGLLLETKEFAITQQQAAALFQVIPTSASKWLKSLLGNTSSLFYVKTNREEVEGKRVRSKELALKILDFERVLRKLDRQGNTTAQSLVDDLIGMSLQQLFSDAFNLHFEKRERQLWLKYRQQHRKQYHPKLTIWLKSDAGGNSTAVNWGKEINIFKAAAKLPIKPVETYNADELQALNTAEIAYDTLRKVGISHCEAIKHI